MCAISSDVLPASNAWAGTHTPPARIQMREGERRITLGVRSLIAGMCHQHYQQVLLNSVLKITHVMQQKFCSTMFHKSEGSYFAT